MTEPDPPGDDCPSDDALLAYVEHLLPPDEAARVDEHVAGCDACCAVLAEAGRALSDDAPEPDDGLVFPEARPAPEPARARPLPEPGAKVGRYLVLDVLGTGAMGVVYAAYDPELDRKVAVKLVRVHGGGARAAELQARLVAEAQAMARLSHPNVVLVHDIGDLGGDIYIAMELVVGRTLGAWLAAEPRSWREIVAVFVQAGDGLAAAHEAGIVHRDFKPDNVLVDARGQVRVTDFGLARMSLREDDALPVEPDARADLTRTRAGTLIGTPADMAPEQLAGRTVDARADVFAFGVALYEALYGARPYAGQTLGELEASLARGVPAEPPAAKVPAWVRRAVLRAVAADPAARFPSMAALTRALRADPARRLRRIGLPLVGLLVAVGVAVGVWSMTTAPARACRAGAERAAPVGSAERRERARAAFAATGQPFAADGFALASEALERHLERWREDRVDACDATHARGEQSEALLDLRLACLDQRLQESDALADVLTRADADVVEHASAAVARPPTAASAASSSACARVPPPADARGAAAVEAAGKLRAQAEADAATGRWQDGIAAAKEAVRLAHEAGHAPTEAEATLALADLTRSSGDFDARARSSRVRCRWRWRAATTARRARGH
ncbi:MAG: protein kinase [Myxococcota bacterium]